MEYLHYAPAGIKSNQIFFFKFEIDIGIYLHSQYPILQVGSIESDNKGKKLLINIDIYVMHHMFFLARIFEFWLIRAVYQKK